MVVTPVMVMSAAVVKTVVMVVMQAMAAAQAKGCYGHEEAHFK